MCFRQLTLRARLVCTFLIFCFLQTQAKTFGQRITLKMQNAPLVTVLKEMRKQSGVDVFYDNKILQDHYKVSVNLKNAELKDALNEVFQHLPLTYHITKEGISITKSAAKPAQSIEAPVQDVINVEGRVVDQDGEPLVGASIVMKKEGRSTLSDVKGNFALKNVTKGCFLVISFVGYQTKEVGCREALGNVVLEILDNPLDAVQIIGYGKTSKRLTTGAVSTVRTEELEKQPVSNPLLALSGRVPGVYISEGSGIAGSQVNIEIRGVNTINGATRPLYIVDGVPFTSTPIEQTSGNQIVNGVVGGGFSPLDNIPTSDIESIDILKDADATAIYGSRAANGVVIITTKKGKAGAMKVNANIYSGVSQLVNRLKMLGTEDYLAIRRQAFANDKITPTLANAPDLLSFGEGYTNFIDYLYGNTASMVDGTVSVSGGSSQAQYLISANHRTQNSIFPYNFNDKKSTIRFNMQTHSQNARFFVNLSGAYTRNLNNLPSASISYYYALPPNLPLHKDDGTFFWHNSYQNPAAALKAPMEATTHNMLLNGSVKYVIMPGLEFKTELGFNRISNENYRAITRESRNPNTTVNGQLSYNLNNNQNLSVEPQFTYQRTLGPGRLEALLGGTYLNTQSTQPLFFIGSFTNDALYKSLTSVLMQFTASGNVESRYLSGFTRLNYVMANKYIVNVNARRDGSSRFGPGNKFGNFGSIGAAWIFGEERFIKDNLEWLNFGKIRGSYGTIGNDPYQDYAYLATYASSAFASNYSGVSSLMPLTLANKDFRWEVTKKMEFALDLNFLKDRLAFTAAWYRNRSDNLLIQVPIATQTGFETYLANLPALVQNKGWEFSLTTKNIARRDFSWSTSINFTASQNKLLSYPGLNKSSLANSYVVGQSLSVAQNYHFLGFEDGIAQFEDFDGDGTITSGSFVTTGKGDQIVSGNQDPKFFGGINNSFQYKNFSLDFLFSFVKKDGYNIYYEGSSVIPGIGNNLVADVLNKPFRYTTMRSGPAAIAYNRYKYSDAVFEDASFIRLKNVSLTYQFEEKAVKPLGLKNLSVYLRGQNLLTFSKYLGFDPETQGLAVPPLRMFTVGLQTTL
ncbi:TonB-linked outer membrane protein, SusC/RagA family [Sphingobacterium psychroaquaticum]|uniref:TonB-linked outer membrane protein, SusC/RagA family n=2 Tax=Sphingobacterium psychroaquaticum TaxID=561061 RepID=A0A1X7IDG2_9SPHI|nr:TonB-linked outer membrane protein, SusC/RagA family [Sphingobacterium psychroaquaticum]